MPLHLGVKIKLKKKTKSKNINNIIIMSSSPPRVCSGTMTCAHNSSSTYSPHHCPLPIQHAHRQLAIKLIHLIHHHLHIHLIETSCVPCSTLYIVHHSPSCSVSTNPWPPLVLLHPSCPLSIKPLYLPSLPQSPRFIEVLSCISFSPSLRGLRPSLS